MAGASMISASFLPHHQLEVTTESTTNSIDLSLKKDLSQLAFREGDAMDFPQLLTEAEAADWLGVPIEAVAMWARDGKLLAAARTEGGQLLFYRWRIERDGASLAAFAPMRVARGPSKRTARADAQEFACGCRLNPAPGRLCRTGAALLAAAALAEDFATSAPKDQLLDRIASLCRDALSRHLTGPLLKRRAPGLPAEVAATVDRLEGCDPALRTAPAKEEAHA
jgi:hypothetical protein